MQKNGELSKVSIIILISFLIIVLSVLAFFIVKNISDVKKGNILVENLDLKISQVKTVDDKTTEITVKRNEGEGEFSSLSFVVDDGSSIEVIKKETSMNEGETETFSLKFILINASRIKRISITPVFIKGNGEEIVGEIEDEYITPNTCSNYCPPKAQCGFNDCGMQCGSGCNSGYLCLNYKCIKEKTSSGGGGGSSGGEESNNDATNENTPEDEENFEEGTDYSNVYLDKGLRYGDALDYQCGSRNIDGTTFNYPGCPTGYNCVNNLCIARDDLTCDGVQCASGEYCSHGVCLLEVSGDTYFVALWGNDSNPGTFEEPFYTWQRGADIAYPGDIIYIRGGIWQPTTYITFSSTIGLSVDPTGYTVNTRSGTKDAPIRYFNYPGEKPILDGELASPTATQWLSGISIGSVEYIYLRGLTIRHIHQTPPIPTDVKPYSEVFGVGSRGANHIFENIVVHDIDGRGFQHGSQSWTLEDALYAVEAGYQETPLNPLFKYDNTTWINCDAYNLFDRYSEQPGNAADGWKVETYYSGIFTWINCRAFNYSDDGFDPHGSGKRIFEGCWAMSTNKYASLSELWSPERNGFKTTGSTGIILSEDEHGVIFENCIATFNAGPTSSGFITNLGAGEIYTSRPLYYNNLAYKNGWGYNDPNNSIMKNNIVYGTQNIDPIGEEYHILSYLQWYNESNNTWVFNDPSPNSHPWNYDNPAFNLTDADFVSLDTSQLMRPRKSDYSLPDVTFGHLAQGSDLIDGGIMIEGYHCSTSGSHPGQNCREWYGSAPDLGPFESNY